jgi:hypothetical protein
MKKCFFILCLVFIVITFSCKQGVLEDSGSESGFDSDFENGYQGIVYERLPDDSIGPRISETTITFTSEDGAFTKTVMSDESGYYKIGLPVARYRVTAEHPDFEPYSSAPGFHVVSGDGYQTGNFFLKRKT